MELKLRVVDLEARKIVYYSDECCLVNAIDLYESDKTKYRLELWTGLKDKNGEDIYAGDIILSGGTYHYKVEWVGQGWYPFCLDESELVGNVYENPELLKQ
jgi:hypothetical protein